MLNTGGDYDTETTVTEGGKKPEKWRYVMESGSEEKGGEGGPRSFGRAEASGWLDIGY